MENASQLYSFNMIAEKIKQKKATGKWTFVILGADFDVWEMGRKLNIDDNKRMRYEKTRTHQTFSDMNMMMQEYVSLKKEGRLKDAYDLSKNKK
jgi:hypothetical protein